MFLLSRLLWHTSTTSSSSAPSAAAAATPETELVCVPDDQDSDWLLVQRSGPIGGSENNDGLRNYTPDGRPGAEVLPVGDGGAIDVSMAEPMIAPRRRCQSLSRPLTASDWLIERAALPRQSPCRSAALSAVDNHDARDAMQPRAKGAVAAAAVPCSRPTAERAVVAAPPHSSSRTPSRAILCRPSTAVRPRRAPCRGRPSDGGVYADARLKTLVALMGEASPKSSSSTSDAPWHQLSLAERRLRRIDERDQRSRRRAAAQAQAMPRMDHLRTGRDPCPPDRRISAAGCNYRV